MVNVVFLLLIFFMVAGAYSSPDMFDITSPNSSSTLQADQTIITIVVDKSGRTAIGDVELTNDNLVFFVNDLITNDPTSVIQIKADTDVEALKVVKLIKSLSSTELSAVHILTTSS